jgi:hypothetical protein
MPELVADCGLVCPVDRYALEKVVEEAALLVNAVADACSDNDADIDRLLDLAWNGARQALG